MSVNHELVQDVQYQQCLAFCLERPWVRKDKETSDIKAGRPGIKFLLLVAAITEYSESQRESIVKTMRNNVTSYD